jgi:hypothetical protein
VSNALLVGWSDDDAKTFDKHALPIDFASIARDTTSVFVQQTDVAVGAHGVVVSALVRAEPNVRALLPSGVTAPNGWAITANGVDVLGNGDACPAGTTDTPKAKRAGAAEAGRPIAPKPSGVVSPNGKATEAPGREYGYDCFAADGTSQTYSAQERRGITRSFSWSELGVSGDLLRAIVGEPFVFAAAPGSTDFRPVNVPTNTGVQSMVLRSDENGFDLVATTAGDGVGPKSFPAKLVVSHSADGYAWSANDAAPQGVEWVSAVGRIDGRVVVIGSGAHGAVMLVDNASGGWTSTSLADVLHADVASDQQVEVMSAAVGPIGVVATVQVVTLHRTVPHGDNASYRILASRDTVTWSDDSLDAIVGEGVFPSRVVMVGDHVVISGSRAAKGNVPAPADSVTVLGTPE